MLAWIDSSLQQSCNGWMDGKTLNERAALCWKLYSVAVMSNVWITSHFLVTLCICVTSSNSGSVGGPSAAAPSQSKLWISTGSSCQRSNMIGWYISQFSCFKSDHLLLLGNEQTDLKGQRGFILIWTLPSFLTSNSVLGTLFELLPH